MTAWVVRGGGRGEYEELFMSESVVSVDYSVVASITEFSSRDALREQLSSRSAADQLWRLAREIRSGDTVVLPRKSPRVIAVGQVSGEYQYRPSLEAPHVRPVNWTAQEIPHADFEADFLNSFGGQGTVYRIRAADAESRLQQIVARHLAGAPIDQAEGTSASPDVPPAGGEDETFRIDLEEQINRRIIERIRQRFFGTRLEYFVASILRASGYHAIETRQGPDGGIDVIAGQGDLGFGHPRLCVQVKSGRSAVDLAEYNRLQGNIGSYGAEHGLLVSLSDFTRSVRNENERSYFQIRLWGPNEIVDRLLDTYDQLPEDIRSEIPIRNRGILIETEE